MVVTVEWKANPGGGDPPARIGTLTRMEAGETVGVLIQRDGHPDQWICWKVVGRRSTQSSPSGEVEVLEDLEPLEQDWVPFQVMQTYQIFRINIPTIL